MEFGSIISDRGDYLFDGGNSHNHYFISWIASVFGAVLFVLSMFAHVTRYWSGVEGFLSCGHWRFNRHNKIHRDDKTFFLCFKSLRRVLAYLVQIIGYIVIILTVRSNLWISWWDERMYPKEDAGYSKEKAQDRLELLWILVLVYVPLLVLKEMSQMHGLHKKDKMTLY